MPTFLSIRRLSSCRQTFGCFSLKWWNSL